MAAVIHGGPGALGEMAPVAKELAHITGVIEPLQTALDLNGQIEELRGTLQEYACSPISLIGHSWGAWLSYIFASRYPEQVKKLILVGSGPFEAKYVTLMNETRTSRLNETENQMAQTLLQALNDPYHSDKKSALEAFGQLMAKTHHYDPIPIDNPMMEIRPEAFQTALNEVIAMRADGKLLRLAEEIRCPIVAIHGEYDPHPYLGVEEPLARTANNFRLVCLEKCGHMPWRERYARDIFFAVLKTEIFET